MDISAGNKVDNKKADLQHFVHFKLSCVPFSFLKKTIFLHHKGKTQLEKCDIKRQPIRSISALKLMLFFLPESTNWENVITLQLHLQNFSIKAYVPFSSRISYNCENVSRKPAHLQGSSIDTCGSIFFLKGLAGEM
jgi:hypothetical protein